MHQVIISIDSQILNGIQLCARRTKYAFIDCIEPPEKAEALERGDLMHKMLEIREGLLSGCARRESETWQAVEGIVDFDSARENPVKAAIEAAQYLAVKMSLPTEEVNDCIFQFQEYSKFYAHDTWETLAVEEVGSKVLFESEETKIIYNFKIDRLARNGEIIAPWDYKTSKRRTETSSMSNQFIGYAWGTDSSYVVIDKIGFQKTLKPEERFQRVILAFDKERIEEWVENTIFWARRYQTAIETDKWEMNLTSCDKYSGCIFRPLCERSPASREWAMERDYIKGKRWDVASVLEAPGE